MSEPTRAYHYLLSGRVQGVGFRHFTRTRARELGLVGTVANLPDGRVEIRVAGDPEALETFDRAVREGPPAGRVEGVRREPLEPAGWDDFRVVHPDR